VFGGVAPVPQPVPAQGLGKPGVAPDVRIPDVVQPFGVMRDSFWPKTAVSWIVLSVALIVISVQLVTPARRWRAGGFLSRLSARRGS
jgi:hypothetical protein